MEEGAAGVRAYKFLARGAVGRFSDFQWPEPGEWVESGQPVVDCLHGVHALREEQLLDWIDDELWEIELGGAVADRNGMLVAERGRLVRRVEDWNDTAARAFADACAKRSGTLAAEALRHAGLNDSAERFEQATDLEAIQEAAVGALERTTGGGVTEVVAFAADLVSLAGGNRPDMWLHTGATVRIAQRPAATAANAAYVAAHVAGRAAVARSLDEDSYEAGFQAERAWQLARVGQVLSL